MFFEMNPLDAANSIKQFVFKMISVLNAGESKDHLNETYLLLASPSLEEAKELASELSQKVQLRQAKIKEMIEKPVGGADGLGDGIAETGRRQLERRLDDDRGNGEYG